MLLLLPPFYKQIAQSPEAYSRARLADLEVRMFGPVLQRQRESALNCIAGSDQTSSITYHHRSPLQLLGDSINTSW